MFEFFFTSNFRVLELNLDILEFVGNCSTGVSEVNFEGRVRELTADYCRVGVGVSELNFEGRVELPRRRWEVLAHSSHPGSHRVKNSRKRCSVAKLSV